MNTLDWARLQFAITTLFHFIFVPLSIGLALFVAICQTRYYRSGDEVWLRATRFWGKFLLVTMAVGVVTGIVQEFQFGMNWSLYSRYVGNIFGPPLAMEGLVAFFAESTFIGLWIFGWDKLPKRLHLSMIWLTTIAAILSAYFILVANSWMQDPVGYKVNAATHRAELTNIGTILFNKTAMLAIPHTVIGAFTTGGFMVIAICAVLLLRDQHNEVIRRSLRMALPFTALVSLITMVIGDSLGRTMITQQPIKMAAAERIWHTTNGAGFQILPGISIPHLTSIIEKLSWNGTVPGLDNLNRQAIAQFGPGNYIPIVDIVYWGFHLMIYAGTLTFVIAVVGMLLRRHVETQRWFQRLMLLGFILPIVCNWGGWLTAEVGRQPWVVFGLLKTSQANSPNVSTTNLVITLTGYIVIYGILIAIGGWLIWREIGNGPAPDPTPGEQPKPEAQSDSMILAY
jgi:cytochrome d ubiquinol oxidase subunit I